MRKKVEEHFKKVDPDGRLPKPEFLKSVELAGQYFCVEILLISKKTGAPVLKWRHDPTATGGEIEWEGKLHIPGIVVPPLMRSEDIVPALIKKEIVKEGQDELADQLAKGAVFWGFVKADEPQRKTIANSLVMTTVIDLDYSRVQKDLVELTEARIIDVIGQHLPILDAYKRNPEGVGFLDTRPKPEPQS